MYRIEDLDRAEDLLEQVVQGKTLGPPREWCSEQLAAMHEWRGHYDPAARGAFPDLGMLVRYGYAMPLMTVPNTT